MIDGDEVNRVLDEAIRDLEKASSCVGTIVDMYAASALDACNYLKELLNGYKEDDSVGT